MAHKRSKRKSNSYPVYPQYDKWELTGVFGDKFSPGDNFRDKYNDSSFPKRKLRSNESRRVIKSKDPFSNKTQNNNNMYHNKYDVIPASSNNMSSGKNTGKSKRKKRNYKKANSYDPAMYARLLSDTMSYMMGGDMYGNGGMLGAYANTNPFANYANASLVNYGNQQAQFAMGGNLGNHVNRMASFFGHNTYADTMSNSPVNAAGPNPFARVGDPKFYQQGGGVGVGGMDEYYEVVNQPRRPNMPAFNPKFDSADLNQKANLFNRMRQYNIVPQTMTENEFYAQPKATRDSLFYNEYVPARSQDLGYKVGKGDVTISKTNFMGAKDNQSNTNPFSRTTPNVSSRQTDPEFDAAFKKASKAGRKTFTFKGKLFTTNKAPQKKIPTTTPNTSVSGQRKVGTSNKKRTSGMAYKLKYGGYPMYQMGGDPMMDQSGAHMNQMAQAMGATPVGDMNAQSNQQGDQMAQLQALAQAIIQGDPNAQSQLEQLPPEIQQQVMQMVQQMQAQAPAQ